MYVHISGGSGSPDTNDAAVTAADRIITITTAAVVLGVAVKVSGLLRLDVVDVMRRGCCAWLRYPRRAFKSVFPRL